MFGLNLIRLRRIGLIIILLFQIAFATKYAGDFEELGVSARAIGLGGAYVAVAADPSAIYYNPAGSVRNKNYGILLMHAESFGGLVKNNYLGIVLPSQNQSFGLGVLNNGVPGIKLTTLPDTTQPPSDTNQPILDREVNASHWVFYLNFGRRLSSVFQVGVNAKMIYQTYGIASSFGMGIDLGGSIDLFEGLNMGLRIRNLTTSPLFWDNKTRELISPKVALGLARTFHFGKDHLLFSIELEANTDNGFTSPELTENIGLEYSLKQTIAVRIGLFHRLVTLGLGLNYRQFFVDYAYQSGYYSQSKDLGSSQRISGGIKF
jgi:hypothetical protein